MLVNIQARPTRSLTVVPDYREQSYHIALELQAALQAEINAIEDPAPIGWWLIYRGAKAFNVWEDGQYASGKPRQRAKRNYTPGLWGGREEARELKRALQAKLDTVNQLIGEW
jgi:hypothetical protein